MLKIGMFYNATSFNQPLNSWDVSNVLFCEGFAFNSPIESTPNIPDFVDCGNPNQNPFIFSFSQLFNFISFLQKF